MSTIRIDRTFEKDIGDGLFHYVVFVDEQLGTPITRTARADWLEQRHLRRMTQRERREVEDLAAQNRAEACRHALTNWPREKLAAALEDPPDEELQRFKLDPAKWTEIARRVLG